MIIQIEITFLANKTSETAKIPKAVQCLDGSVLIWFRIKYEKNHIILVEF